MGLHERGSVEDKILHIERFGDMDATISKYYLTFSIKLNSISFAIKVLRFEVLIDKVTAKIGNRG